MKNKIELHRCSNSFYLFRINNWECDGLDTLHKIILLKKKMTKNFLITKCVLTCEKGVLLIPVENSYLCSSYFEANIKSNSLIESNNNYIKIEDIKKYLSKDVRVELEISIKK